MILHTISFCHLWYLENLKLIINFSFILVVELAIMIKF